MKHKIAVALALIVVSSYASANLLRNPSFEMVPGSGMGQGLMPREWITVQVTPDTYSNDGSYGLAPSTGGNFLGVTAFDGIRWVAGWSAADERFGQLLSAPLVGGQEYTFSGYLIQAKRADLDHPGGYELFLTDAGGAIASGTLVGSVGPTTDSDDWEFFSFDFTAPGGAATLPLLVFKPFGDISGTAYAGLDSVALTTVPVPGGVWLLGSGVLSLLGYRQRC